MVIPEVSVTADRRALKAFACAERVDFCPPTYTVRDARPELTSLLSKIGQVESFYILPWRRGDAKMRIIACFTRSEHVEAAIGAYDGRSLACVGHKRISLHRTYSIRYTVPKTQWLVVREHAQQIRAEGQSHAILRIVEPSEFSSDEPTVLYIQGDDASPLSALKNKVQTIVRGEILRNDAGSVVWDRSFFTGAVGPLFLETLNLEKKVFVICDSRLRNIRICGSPLIVAETRTRILLRLDLYQRDRRVVPVPPSSLRHFARGGLRSLQNALGEDSVFLDWTDGVLIFRCSDDEFYDVRRSVNHIVHGRTRLAETRVRPRTSPSDKPPCPVCQCTAVDPIKLGCGHEYCKQCLQLYLASAVNSESLAFPIRCITQASSTPAAIGTSGSSTAASSVCGVGIPARVLQGLLSPDKEQTLLEAAFLAYIHAHPMVFRFCPTPDCDQVYRVSTSTSASQTLFTCPSCLETTCTECHSAHPGLSCTQYRKSLRTHNDAPSAIKNCPSGCGALLQKQDGCNHVVCPICKVHMCWICLATFPRGGVYEHIALVHGEGEMPGEMPADLLRNLL